jgi:two-component system response regulator HydG
VRRAWQRICSVYRIFVVNNAKELRKEVSNVTSRGVSTLTSPRPENPDVVNAGDPTALLARTHDLSHRLQEHEEFYRWFIESIGEGVIITDSDSRILYVNSRFEFLTGYPQSELIGRISYEVLMPKEEWPAMHRRLKERLAGKEESYEYEQVRKDGQRHWVSVRAVPYRNGRGEIAGTIGLLSSINERKTLELENEYLQEELRGNYRAILGDSPALKKVLAQIGMVAPTNAGVLILGESGTGKELIAGAIHHNSHRKEGPLVKMNCAAVTETLLESELFGHEKGAFTGAYKRKEGRFVQADGGTLFLDEVSEMSLGMQAKLLRVLQEMEITRVGGEETLKVDVRLVAATNKDLMQEIEAGRFREDLFYRLNVVTLRIPPLRERHEDIPLLAQHFLTQFAQKNQKKVKGFTPQAMDRFLKYDWPGNVRELMNAVERAVVLSRSDYLGDEEFVLVFRNKPEEERSEQVEAKGPANLLLEEVEKTTILNTLDAAGGNKSEAARRLGITRRTLHKKLKKYGLMD